MQKAKGSLAEYIKMKGGKVPIPECREIISQILEGLKYLHSLDIAHRDMKPGNILMMSYHTLKNAVKITDFSISAKLTDVLPAEISDTMGTPKYKAPEQFTGQPCSTVNIIKPFIIS